MMCEEILSKIANVSQELLSDNLVGIYLHGSLATGCFNPEKSDIDLLAVVGSTITKETLDAYLDALKAIDTDKMIDLHIIEKKHCDPFVYPTPYLLAYSKRNENGDFFGESCDIAADISVIRTYGSVIYGKDIADVFAEIVKEDYIDSILYRIENAREDVFTNTCHTILDLCTVSAYLKDGLILSRKAGGKWAMKTLSKKYYSLLASALAEYTSTQNDDAAQISASDAFEFADIMLYDIEKDLSQML